MKTRKGLKCFLLGMVIAAVFSTAVPAMAAIIQKQITVSTGVNIYVDDVKLNPVDAKGNPVEVFIYNGTTYLPVRAVAEAIGKPVMWEGKTSSVYLGKHDSEEPTVMLHELEYFDSGGSNRKFKTHKDVKDNLENSYNYGITSDNSHRGNYPSWQTYYINGMYSKIKGTYILAYDQRDNKDENRFKVYGDDKLIYSSPVMTGGVHPVDFDIDLSGVLELKIEIDNYMKDNCSYLVNTGLYQ